MRVTKGSGNVFVDCGFPPAEAENLRIRAKLMMALTVHIQERKLTQSRAAKLMAIRLPTVKSPQPQILRDLWKLSWPHKSRRVGRAALHACLAAALWLVNAHRFVRGQPNGSAVLLAVVGGRLHLDNAAKDMG